MAQYHRILWSEGLFITPQHFQQWDLFHETQLAERIATQSPFPWGVFSLDVDQENLARGTFRLVGFRGVFPSGAIVHVPQFDSPPESVPFADEFGIKADYLDIYLSLPVLRGGWPNTKLSEDATGGEELRFLARTVSVPDQNTGRDERAIQRAEQHLQILLGTQMRDNYESLHIARVQRSSTGEFQLDEGFVPPLLAVGGSPFLVKMCRGMLERLSSRSSELGSRFTDSGVNARDITNANLRAFLQFFAINGALPQLAHLREIGSLHPEVFYRMFAGLVGQLCSFNPTKFHPRDVPAYNHQSLGTVFKQLQSMLEQLLDIREVAQGYDVIPLAAGADGRYTASIQKSSHLEPNSVLILSIAGDAVPEAMLLSAITRVILTSQERVDELLARSLPGLPLRHLAVPPPAIPRSHNTYYFQLDKAGPHWEAIRESHGLGLQIPGDLRTMRFELLGLSGA
ncbi:MAG: type VI secretion system baseplate subunit TssK [Candidatus Eisenbacteria bacterium]